MVLRSLPVLTLSLTQPQTPRDQPRKTQWPPKNCFLKAPAILGDLVGLSLMTGEGWALGCLRPGLERREGQEGKREDIWEEDRVTLKSDPHHQPRNDRLRRGPGMLLFSALITIILRRLESKT